MTQDFKNQRRWTPADETQLDRIMKRLTYVVMFLVCATALAQLLIEPASAQPENLISPDLESYIAHYGQPLHFDEGDMQ